MRKTGLRTTILAVACLLSLAVSAQGSESRPIDIPPGDLVSSLQALIRQSGAELAYREDLLIGLRTRGVHGTIPAEQALQKLLEGSGFTAKRDPSGALIILKKDALLPKTEPRAGVHDIPAMQSAESEMQELETITVTGTNIRGTVPSAPLTIVTREDIDRSGYSQLADVVRSLPQNYSGGQNPGVIGAFTTNVDNQNGSNASTVNLRGFGSDATLVLLNGNRLANDSTVQAPDISIIPLQAVQRIEIVTDGASALYGADAVGGVANIIMRPQFDGAEIGIRYGAAARGGGAENVFNSMAGTSWETGAILGAVEFRRQDEILASDRSFTSEAYPETTLLGANRRASGLVHLRQDISSNVSFMVDGLYSDRESTNVLQGRPTWSITNWRLLSKAYLIAPSLEVTLPGEWYATLRGNVSGSETRKFDRISNALTNSYNTDTWSTEVSFDGPIVDMGSGTIKGAFGAGHRAERFDYRDSVGPKIGERKVNFAFGELRVPLIPEDIKRVGLNSLQLSIAGRIEKYDSFGTSANPKVGLTYAPTQGLTLRSSWGTSFKVPRFDQLYTEQFAVYFPSELIGSSTPGYALYFTGGNSGLGPEESESWTVGFDYSPVWRESLKLSVNYFSVDYNDRILYPISNNSTSLSNPAFVPFVIHDPSFDLQSRFLDRSSKFYNFAGVPYDPADVTELVDNRYVNISSWASRGVDASIVQAFNFGNGKLDFHASGTWQSLKQQNVSTVQATTLSGIVGSPPKFRARGGASWSQGGLTATATLNYVSGSRDIGITPERRIDAWTTIDTNIAYRFMSNGSRLSGLKVSLSVTNLFDNEPPFAAGPGVLYQGLNYDSTNASPIGRFVAISVVKSWP